MDSTVDNQPEKIDSVPSFSGSNSPALTNQHSHVTLSKESDSIDLKDDEYLVTLTVTIALAYVQTSEENARLIEDLIKKNKRTVEAPKPQQFFHCEYTAGPGHVPTVCDIVTYGVAAKLFSETDSRVVKTWDDHNLTWVAWNHSHDIVVSENNVLELYDHVINVELWDSKDKVSTKARFDRPKAFRLPSQKGPGPPGHGVAAVVAKQSQSWMNLQPRDSGSKIKIEIDSKTPKEEEEEEENPESIETQQPTIRVHSSLGRLAGLMSSKEDKKRIEDLKLQQSYLMKELERHKKPQSGITSTKHMEMCRTPSAMQRKARDSNHASASTKSTKIPVKLEALFAGGCSDITYRLEETFASVRDMFVGVSVAGNLLPKDLERKLNPLLIKIKSVKDLPENPISREMLNEKCQPVYCVYQFPFNEIHRTKSRPRAKDVYFEDTHVILAGKIEPGKLFEFFQSNFLTVEIHDRDRKLPDESKPSIIFGQENDDKKIGNVGLVTGKPTTHNAFHDRERIYDPFGVAQLSFADFLKGQKVINFHVVVKPCRMPLLISDPSKPSSGRLVGVSGAVDRPENPPLLPGDYIQEGTILKVKVELRYPLQYSMSPRNKLSINVESCPFGRIVCFFNFDNKAPIKFIDQLVKQANAKALNLDQFEPHVMDAALSSYKLSAEQKLSKTIDLVTGFHVIDGKFHFLMLEGLRLGAIKNITKEIEYARQQGSLVDIAVLFDTSYQYSSRLYANLDASLCSIRLHQPLDVILSQPLLYVRDLVPRPCFECLTRINKILSLHRFCDICFSDLFPTHEMVISMSREFGVPLTYDDYEEQHKLKEGEAIQLSIEKSSDSDSPLVRSAKWEQIDNSNPQYEEFLRQKENNQSQPNYVLENIIAVQEDGKRRRPKSILIYGIPNNAPAHNYSTQTLNSTDLARNSLRKLLYEQDTKSRFTYHPMYNSAMVPPVTPDEYYEMQDKAARQKWRTESGFIYPGVKTSLTSNEHSLRPVTSRIEELKLRWRENILHANVLEPTVKNREKMKWEDRFIDMELFQQPQTKASMQTSIHLPGVLRHKEKTEFEKMEKEAWKSRIVVDDTNMKFHRVAITTEQTNKSNQIDKLASLLKDKPQKFSLKILPANKLPPLSVVGNPSVDMEKTSTEQLSGRYAEEKSVGFCPGPFDDVSWKRDHNRISIQDPQHKMFESLKGHDFNCSLKKKMHRKKQATAPS